LDKPSAYISVVAASFFVLAVAFVWGEVLTINSIAVLGLMDFNDFVSAALLAGSFFLPMAAVAVVILLLFGGAKYFNSWDHLCPPVLTLSPVFVVLYTAFYFFSEKWPLGALFTPALAIVMGYAVRPVMRAFLTRQESAHLRDWAPAVIIAFAAMVAQGWSFTLSQARSAQCVEVFGERRDMAKSFILALDRGAMVVGDREAILYPWNKIDFVWLSDNPGLKIKAAAAERCLIVHPTPRIGA
jgi:hypothetical protein